MSPALRTHFVLGFSPFNPAFSHAWLCRTFSWAARNYDTIDILHPGALAETLLVATGTPPGRAARKCRQQKNRDFRNIDAALEDTETRLAHGAPVVLSEEMHRPWYQNLLRDVSAEFNRNPSFHSACRAVSASAVASRLSATDPSRIPNLDTAVSYVIKETPAFTHCSRLFGYPTATLGYPGAWAVGQCLEAGHTSLATDPGTAYLNLRGIQGAHNA